MNLTNLKAIAHETITHAFSRPRVLACTSLSEVLPLDLMLLRVQVTGWGWLEIQGPQGFTLRDFFRSPATLEVTVPVRTSLTLKVRNAWGSRSYPIDTHTPRNEVWRPPEGAFGVRLPEDLQPVYDRFGTPVETQLPRVALPSMLTPPTLVTLVPGFKLRASPSELTTPEIVVRTLPAIVLPERAPAQPALPAWNPQLPMATLESRMAQVHIEP
jgi:hypothetical protein